MGAGVLHWTELHCSQLVNGLVLESSSWPLLRDEPDAFLLSSQHTADSDSGK